MATYIVHMVRDNPEVHVSAVVKEVHTLFHAGCSYKKRYARHAAIEMVYGSWSSTFELLPTYMQALKYTNPGTIVKWRHYQSKRPEQTRIFGSLF